MREKGLDGDFSTLGARGRYARFVHTCHSAFLPVLATSATATTTSAGVWVWVWFSSGGSGVDVFVAGEKGLGACACAVAWVGHMCGVFHRHDGECSVLLRADCVWGESLGDDIFRAATVLDVATGRWSGFGRYGRQLYVVARMGGASQTYY